MTSPLRRRRRRHVVTGKDPQPGTGQLCPVPGDSLRKPGKTNYIRSIKPRLGWWLTSRGRIVGASTSAPRNRRCGASLLSTCSYPHTTNGTAMSDCRSIGVVDWGVCLGGSPMAVPNRSCLGVAPRSKKGPICLFGIGSGKSLIGSCSLFHFLRYCGSSVVAGWMLLAPPEPQKQHMEDHVGFLRSAHVGTREEQSQNHRRSVNPFGIEIPA